MIGYWVKKILGFIVLGTSAILVITYLFMLLWNMLIPDLFNGPILNFYQALGLMVLAKMLFGFGSVGKQYDWKNKESITHFSTKKEEWKQKLESKMAHMSNEDKEKFKNSMKGWCYGKNTENEKFDNPENQTTNKETL